MTRIKIKIKYATLLILHSFLRKGKFFMIQRQILGTLYWLP